MDNFIWEFHYLVFEKNLMKLLAQDHKLKLVTRTMLQYRIQINIENCILDIFTEDDVTLASKLERVMLAEKTW